MPALLLPVAVALLVLLGAGRAAAPGAWALLKRWALGCLLLCLGSCRQRAAAGTAEPRRPRPLRADPHHPQHPNMMVRDESKEIWSGGGLTMEYLEPQMCWKINFDGLLRKGSYRQQWSEEEGELVAVQFSLQWENSTDVFNFNVDSNPSTFARALAQEPWTIELFQRVKKQREQHFRHEQWGRSVGEIEIENYGKTELALKGVRSHSYGVRNWAEIHRYVMILAHFEDGTAAHLTVINMPATTTHLTVGYVFFPDGRKAGIEWSNASLAELAEDGVIQDEYGVSFTAGGESFDVSAALDKQTCPVVYNGLTGSGVFHECIADFQLNGLTRGWGLVEFYYRYQWVEN
ncbi:hypothetical protein TURU_096200 [Turdus rufiventris]|nr:hypothetical protein TURU_096200 [Turdus rufiventris]